jgi:hypothetical protein
MSSTPASSTIRRWAKACSAGVSQLEEVSGKSGRMYMAQMATNMVMTPSTKKSHLKGRLQMMRYQVDVPHRHAA